MSVISVSNDVGQMLPGKMLPEHFSIVKEEQRERPLNLGQYQMSNSWDKIKLL